MAGSRLSQRKSVIRSFAKVPPGMWLELRGAISGEVKLSDCRLAFKQLSG
jgi:hypothetical protein